MSILLTSILAIIAIFTDSKQILDMFSTEEFGAPVLLSTKITDSITGKTLTTIKENSNNLIEVKISYKGKKKFIFETLYVKHIRGNCASMPSGQFNSDAKYKLEYDFDSESALNLKPEIMLNPNDRSIIKFDVELSNKGVFPASCGRVFAKVQYIDEKGLIGYLPLSTANDIKDGTVKIPMFGSKNTELLKYEIYTSDDFGAIKGKYRKTQSKI